MLILASMRSYDRIYLAFAIGIFGDDLSPTFVP